MKDLEAIKTANGSFVIFAAQPNAVHDVMSFLVENKIPFKVLLGSYNGERETSYCVPAEHFDTVIQAGLVAEQESILVLGHFNSSGLRKAEIVFLNGQETESVGFFVNVEREEAFNQAGWTFDPMGEKFFTIKSAAQLVEAGLLEKDEA